MKRTYVANLREGDRIEDVFLVASKSVQNTRAGSLFLKLRLADKTGSVDAVKWNATESEISRAEENDYIAVHGHVRTYQDNLQVVVDSFQRQSEAVDPSDFLRSSEKDVDAMLAEYKSLLDSVQNPHLRRLLDAFFGDQDFLRQFAKAPAAERIHHAYIGGLLEHTLNVVRVCISLAELYPQADRDLLIAGAALHDVGKVSEFDWQGAIRYSAEGTFVGHIFVGAARVRDAVQAIDGFDEIMGLALQHMVLSHHGMKEWGSPKEPKTIEAALLHAADNVDAQVAIMEQAAAESDNAGERGMFTKRHYLLQRPLFKGFGRVVSSEDEQGGDEAPDLELFTAEIEDDPFADE